MAIFENEQQQEHQEQPPKHDSNDSNNEDDAIIADDHNNNDQENNCIQIKNTNETSFNSEIALTPRYKRMFILISTMFETIIFSGLIFGWPSLFYMLKNEKIYSHLCYDEDFNDTAFIDSNYSSMIVNDSNLDINSFKNGYHQQHNNLSSSSCIPQENILNLAFTIGIFAMGFTSFLWGFMLESKGLRFVRIALNILISLGCLLLSLTDSEKSIQIVPAIIILGLIGVPLRIANMQIADFFPSKRSTIITFYSGAFSSSPIVFVLIKYTYDQWSIGYMWSTIILFIISITILPLNTYFLPKLSVRLLEKKLWKRYDEYCFKAKELNLLAENSKNKPYYIEKKLFNNLNSRYADYLLLEKNPTNVDGNNNKPVIVNFTKLQQEREQERNLKKISNTDMLMIKSSNLTDEQIPLKVSLLSISFIFHQLWFAWINTYMVLYSGSMALWLERVTNDKQIKNDFTQTFGIVQCSALIIAPLAGWVMDIIIKKAINVENLEKRKLIQAQSGFYPILFTTLTLFGAVVCRFYDTPFAVYLSIAFITLLRALFIAVASAYLRIRFPASHFNRLNGIMCTVGAFFSLLQFPLFYFESKSLIGAFWVNMFCAIMTGISFLNPITLRFTAFQKKLLIREHKHAEFLHKKRKVSRALSLDGNK